MHRSPHARRLTIGMILLALLASVLASCASSPTATGASGGSGGSTPNGGASQNPTAYPGAPIGPSKSWAELFARVPGYTDVEGASLEAVDLAAARKLSGFKVDGDGRDGSVGALAEVGIQFAPSFWTTQPKDWKDVLGIYPYAADRSIEISVPGKDAIVVLEGSFDVAAITEKLKAPGALGPDATSATYAGATFLQAPGEEMKINPKQRGFFEELGRPVRVLVAPDHLVVSLTDDGMHRAIDAWTGKGTASADAEFADAVKALDSVSAISVFGMTDPSSRASRGTTPANKGTTRGTRRTATTTPLPATGDPARIVLVGATMDGGRTGAYLVALKSSANDARATSERIEALAADGESDTTGQPWKDLLALDDLRTEGPLVSATFTTERPTIVRDAYQRRDNLTVL